MDPAPPSLRSMLRSVKNPLWSAAALFIVVEGMREAREILMPIAVAVMLAIICSPAVRWLREHRVPNVLAVVLVVVAIMAALAGLGALVGASLTGFRDNIPAYRDRLSAIVDGTLVWLNERGLRVERGDLLSTSQLQSATETAAAFMVDSVSRLGDVISKTFLVVLTMILILLESRTVPGKLRALSSESDADISQYSRIVTDVQRYLAIKTLVSLGTGLTIGLWAAILGVDFAALWGLLAFLLNYIPNIGSILAAIPAVLLALMQNGITNALVLLAGYVVVNMVVGNLIEPMWMGRKLGLSTAVVFISLVVWNWVWGPVGMLLSVPLTMILKIMLEKSRDWSVVAVLLDSGEPGSLAATIASEPSTPAGEPPAPASEPPPATSRAESTASDEPSAGSSDERHQ